MQGTERMTYEARGLDAHADPPKPGDPVRLSSGAVVRAKALPAFLLNRIYAANPDPPPPMVEVDDGRGGVRRESNPNDPDYLQELERHRLRVAQKILDVVLLRGVEVLETPPDVPALEDDAWLVEAEYLTGEEIPREGPGRRLAWLEMFIFLGAEDFSHVQQQCLTLSGVPTEEAVRAAEDGFPRPS